MTVKEAITRADHDRRNDISETEKVGFLSELDLKIKNAILDRYEGEPVAFSPYDVNEDATLLVPEPYTDLYLYWLQSKAALLDDDIDQYNAWNTLFQQAYDLFFRHYNATHTRKNSGNFRF
ncbi:MAG: hypothetical protein IJ043_03090 [Clostridia bacterium]|nr:hypothetical protein [Clostridia bacterium]